MLVVSCSPLLISHDKDITVVSSLVCLGQSDVRHLLYTEEESFPLPLTDVFVRGIVESDIESSYFPDDVSLYVIHLFICDFWY